MLYKPPEQFIWCHIKNHSTNQIAGNSLFSSEIILIYITISREALMSGHETGFKRPEF